MTSEQAAKIVEVLAEMYPRPDGSEWTPAKLALWVSLIIDLPAEPAQDAVQQWCMGEIWAPKPVEFRKRTWECQNARAERQRMAEAFADSGRRHLELVSGPEEPATTGMPVDKLHLLWAALGKPCKSPECQTCQQGRAVGG